MSKFKILFFYILNKIFKTGSLHGFEMRNVLSKYKFVKILLQEEGSNVFVVLLKDSKNKKVVAKVWQGAVKDFSYLSLKREYLVYKTFSRVLKRLKNVPAVFKNIKIPKLLKYTESNNQAMLVIEYISGVEGSTVEESRFAVEYFKVCDYLEYLGDNMTKIEKKILGYKSYKYQLLAYPLFFIKALLSNPTKALGIFHGIKTLVKLSVCKTDNRKKVLIHGDLNFDNLMFTNNKTYIIDFQFTVFSYREFGYINTLRAAWSKNRAISKLENLINKYIIQGKVNKNTLMVSIIIHGTQGLTATNFKQKSLSAFVDFIMHGADNFVGLKFDFKNKFFIICRRFVLRIITALRKLFYVGENGNMVLCYHSFSNLNNRYAVSPIEFENQVRKITQNSHFVSSKEFFSVDNSNDRTGVLLTIDDGLKSVLDILPITIKYKIPVVLFILSSPEKADRKELDTDEDFLSWEDIKFLAEQGWEIGCHSATHVNFENLPEKLMQEEIFNSKQTIEEKIGKKIDCFAYPKGIHNEKIKTAVKKAGYKFAFSILPGRFTSKSDVFAIPRTIIDQTHQTSDFPALYSRAWLAFREFTSPLKLWEKFLT